MNPIFKLFIFLLISIVSGGVHAQGTLEYHGQNSVQRMPDARTFRFLSGGMGDDWLTEFSTYEFPGYMTGDTVAWQYNESEDQLYIAAWNPKKAGKKHEVKMAIAWRVTSGNPRFGKVKVPAHAQFLGFGDERAFFTVPGKQNFMTLFFDSKYNSGIATVDYTLKFKEYKGSGKPEYDYFSRTENYNYTGKTAPNPYGPEQTRKRLEREEFVQDSSLSPKLQAIKQEFKSKPEDSVWGKQQTRIYAYSDSFLWQNGGRYTRTFTQTYVFIEDKYYPGDLLNIAMLSEHKELFGDREITLKPFYKKDGVKGWRMVTQTLPLIQMKMYLVLPKPAPVLTVDYETENVIPPSGYFLPESLYPKDSFVQAIAASTDPYNTGETFWAEYALDHGIACSASQIRAAITSIYKRSGLSFDGYHCNDINRNADLTGSIRPSFQNFFVVVIYPFGVPVLNTKIEGYKWNTPPLKEWERLSGQNFRIFSSHFGYPVHVGEYEYKLEENYTGYEKCVLFFSEPDGNKHKK